MNRVARALALTMTAGGVALAFAVPTAAVARDLEHQDREHHVVRENPEPRDGASTEGEEAGDAAHRDDRAADAQPREDEAVRDTDGQQTEQEGAASEGTESDERENDQSGDREDSEQAESPEDETAPTQRPEPAPWSEQTTPSEERQRPEPTKPDDGLDTPDRTAPRGVPEGAPEVRDGADATTTFADQRRATLTQLSRAEAYLAQARGRVDAAPIAPLFKQAMLAVFDVRLRAVAGLIDHAEVVETKAELGGVRRQALERPAPRG